MASMQCELWMISLDLYYYLRQYTWFHCTIALVFAIAVLLSFSSNFQENVIFGGNKIWRQQILAELNLAVFRQSPILVPVKYKFNKVVIRFDDHGNYPISYSIHNCSCNTNIDNK